MHVRLLAGSSRQRHRSVFKEEIYGTEKKDSVGAECRSTLAEEKSSTMFREFRQALPPTLACATFNYSWPSLVSFSSLHCNGFAVRCPRLCGHRLNAKRTFIYWDDLMIYKISTASRMLKHMQYVSADVIIIPRCNKPQITSVLRQNVSEEYFMWQYLAAGYKPDKS